MERHLPADILPDILSRLAVKSLLRFRCVSKPWLALVDHDADLARLHFNTFSNNSDETLIVVAETLIDRVETRLDCTVRCPHTFKIISEIPFSLHFGWRVFSSLHDLILLKSTVHRDSGLKLWYPSLRQFHDVSPVPSVGPSMVETLIGLGYDQLAEDYKLVMLIFVRESTVLPSLAIYSVGAGSWKIVPNQKKSCNWLMNSSLTSSVYLKGSLYFIATNPHIYGGWDLVSFDQSNEVFSSVPLYDTRFYSLRFTREKKLVSIDGRFYVSVNDIYSNKESVWVLERECEW